MSKTAWVFPGQGSQAVGMGLELYERYPSVKELYEEADALLGYGLSSLCFHGPEEELTRTSNTQPALLVTSVATARVLQSMGLSPDGVAGHSLGEYAALVVSGALTFADALKTVRLRGQLMEEAAPLGTMAAVLGLERDVVEQLCRDVADEGVVEPATYNGPGQIVVAGEIDAVNALKQRAEQKGARRVTMLNVSGPFHSSMLQEAGRQLGVWLDEIDVQQPKIPVISNVTASPYTTPAEIRGWLTRQVSEAVLWEDSIRYMIAAGYTSFTEVGPGRVLSGLIRRISRDVTVAQVNTVEHIEALLRASKEGAT